MTCVKTRFYFKHGVEGVKAKTKTMTRRRVDAWREGYTNKIKEAYETGSLLRAQTNYGTKTQFGWLKITNMYLQRFGDMPLTDVRREGFPEYSLKQFKELDCFEGCTDDTIMWVLEFDFFPLSINQ